MKKVTNAETSHTEKTFDRLLWPFIFEMCEFFDFQQTFITMIKGMYKQAEARVMANENIFEAF